jgi:hypothetical protein
LLPGLVLSFSRDAQLIPSLIVRWLYPYAVLSWEKSLLAEAQSLMPTTVSAIDFSIPSASNEQIAVVAFLSFFFVFLVVGLQTWNDALFSDQRIENLPAMFILLPVALLPREQALYILFAHMRPQAPQWHPPTSRVASDSVHFFAPAQFVFSTCLVATSIHSIGRIAYLFFPAHTLLGILAGSFSLDGQPYFITGSVVRTAPALFN